MSAPQVVSSGVPQLDRLLDGLLIGDNVIWHDHAGSLAEVFSLNFIKSSRDQKKPLIYASFDRSPKNLVDKLGALADYPELIILDCFTAGKGERSEVFTKFYDEQAARLPFRLELMENPRNVAEFSERLYDLHSTLSGDVRLVFESLTGMAELWGGEEAIVEFYSRACPRLYELEDHRLLAAGKGGPLLPLQGPPGPDRPGGGGPFHQAGHHLSHRAQGRPPRPGEPPGAGEVLGQELQRELRRRARHHRQPAAWAAPEAAARQEGPVPSPSWPAWWGSPPAPSPRWSPT